VSLREGSGRAVLVSGLGRGIAAAAFVASLSLAACGGGGSATATSTPRSASPTGAPPAATSTPAGSAVASAGSDEVTGIVGVVINTAATHAISIQRLSGAPVTKIEVGAATTIRRASGGTLTLGEVRPSERIVARGHLNDRRDALVADEITLQEVIQDGPPGG